MWRERLVEAGASGDNIRRMRYDRDGIETFSNNFPNCSELASRTSTRDNLTIGHKSQMYTYTQMGFAKCNKHNCWTFSSPRFCNENGIFAKLACRIHTFARFSKWIIILCKIDSIYAFSHMEMGTLTSQCERELVETMPKLKWDESNRQLSSHEHS